MSKTSIHAQAKQPTFRTDIHDPNLLCDTCKAIDLHEAFRVDVDCDLGYFVADLKASAEELKASNCALCRLFGALAPNLSDDHSSCRSETCHLRSFSGTFGSLAITGLTTTLLGVDRFEISDRSSRGYSYRTIGVRELYEPGYLCRYQADKPDAAVGVRLICPDSFDLAFVKQCLDYCQTHHGPKCQVARKSEMKQLSLIDCETLSIVDAPQDCDYVALSYVWGPIKTSEPDAGRRDKGQPRVQDAPKAILDSIEVTLQVGLKFLWIDRYCINQLDEQQKYDQIQQMDLVYANAQLTIIAAEGQDPSSGLPGVRGNLRTHQPSLDVGRHRLVSTLPSIRFAVETSKWETRGWTYQEGLLSHRRLIFTRYQSYFACNEMCCAESVDWSLDRLHFQSKNDFDSECDLEPKYAGKVGAFANEQLGGDPWASIKHISEFNRRALTFPEDALNAMQGIFNRFRSNSRPAYHFLGVPIPPDSACSKSAKDCFIIGLSWKHSSPGQRRIEFPSWSWAGWSGHVSSKLCYLPRDPIMFNHVEICVEWGEECTIQFPEWDRLASFLSEHRSSTCFLHITADIICCSVVKISGEDIRRSSEQQYQAVRLYLSDDGYHVKIDVDQDTSMYVRVFMDQNVKNLTSSDSTEAQEVGADYAGILFESLKTLGHVFVLMIEEKRDHAERIGTFHIGTNVPLWSHKGVWYCRDGFNRGLPFPMPLSADDVVQHLSKTRRTIRLG